MLTPDFEVEIPSQTEPFTQTQCANPSHLIESAVQLPSGSITSTQGDKIYREASDCMLNESISSIQQIVRQKTKLEVTLDDWHPFTQLKFMPAHKAMTQIILLVKGVQVDRKVLQIDLRDC